MSFFYAADRLRILSISLGRRGGFPLYGFEMTRALCDICDVGTVYAAGTSAVTYRRDANILALEKRGELSNETDIWAEVGEGRDIIRSR